MNSKKLLQEIRGDLEDYPVEYQRKKVKDPRYPDNIYKHIAKYNLEAYEEIFNKEFEDFNINDKLLENLNNDLDYYLNINGSTDEDNKFTKAICLYLALISKKPLHPVGDSKTYNVYISNNEYYCKDRVKYIKDKNSLCKYCSAKKANFFQF